MSSSRDGASHAVVDFDDSNIPVIFSGVIFVPVTGMTWVLPYNMLKKTGLIPPILYLIVSCAVYDIESSEVKGGDHSSNIHDTEGRASSQPLRARTHPATD